MAARARGPEIAVTVALLVVTGGMVNTYSRNYRDDIGFSTHPLILIRVEHEKGVPVARVRDHLAGLPGVANAAASTSLPFFAAGTMQRVSIERTGAHAERAEVGAIGPDYFATLGVSMRTGRAFTNQDSPATRTAIVNELLASRLFPAGTPSARRSGSATPLTKWSVSCRPTRIQGCSRPNAMPRRSCRSTLRKPRSR